MRGSSPASAQYLVKTCLIFPDPIKELQTDASEDDASVFCRTGENDSI